MGMAGPGMHTSFQLQSKDDFEAATKTRAPSGKRYFQHRKLVDIIGAYPMPDVSPLGAPSCCFNVFNHNHQCRP